MMIEWVTEDTQMSPNYGLNALAIVNAFNAQWPVAHLEASQINSIRIISAIREAPAWEVIKPNLAPIYIPFLF